MDSSVPNTNISNYGTEEFVTQKSSVVIVTMVREYTTKGLGFILGKE
jgi:hypothetical protein